MINRVMLFGCLVLVTLLSTGCGGKHLIFGTYTEFDVAGIEAKPTGDIALKIGFDRGELAYVPDNGQDGYSVLGTFDSDVQLFSGYYVNEVFATGKAADIASAGIAKASYTTTEKTDSTDTAPVEPLLLTTGTRFGFHSIFSLKGGAVAPVDILLGYKRANFTVVPTKKGSPKARSVYADIVIGEGTRRMRAALKVGAPTESQGITPTGKGIIINQRIATGKAAMYLASNGTIQNKLFNLENDLKTVNDLSEEIKNEVERLKNTENQSAFEQAKFKLAELAEIDNSGISNNNFVQKAQAYLDTEGLKKLLNFIKQLR